MRKFIRSRKKLHILKTQLNLLFAQFLRLHQNSRKEIYYEIIYEN